MKFKELKKKKKNKRKEVRIDTKRDEKTEKARKHHWMHLRARDWDFSCWVYEYLEESRRESTQGNLFPQLFEFGVVWSLNVEWAGWWIGIMLIDVFWWLLSIYFWVKLVYRIVVFGLCKFGLMFDDFGKLWQVGNGCSVCSAQISATTLFLSAIALIWGAFGA